ncbi:cyclin-T1-3 isoform X2 [Prunus persica]|uniref:cyclin-T1-3 isoform X2 n=1 Tax=Prunus persica TaxID=3760 RepID=UPI0009AB871E|nr:cyclin-T1-3 isoform X2 [Prunus persica]
MAGFLPAESSHSEMSDVGSYKDGQDRLEEGACWYFYRKEIEENSPSRRDGIDLKKETYLRKSYCTYLQDLGMRLKVPQLTIATSIIFCHRFFLRQSHAKNDRRTIATVCMFLAGKVEETPRPLKDVILVSYEIIHKKDPKAVQRIKQKEVYEQQKELILLGERVVLGTLGFDLNVLHPYKPLVEAIKKFQVAQNALAQVAWNFVNDGLRTSLCLQFKPHHIAAGAIFLAAKFLKVKLPSDGERVWWQEFDVTPRQLEGGCPRFNSVEVSNQMLELYEQNRVPASNEVEGTAASGAAHRAPAKATTSNEEYATSNSNLQGGDTRPGTLKLASSRPESEQLDVGNDNGPPRNTQSLNNDNRSTDIRNAPDHNVNVAFKDNQYSAPLSSHQEQMGDAQNVSKSGSEGRYEEGQEDNGKFDTREAGELKAKQFGRSLENGQGALGQSPQDVIKKIDKNKVKAALEKRRKSQGDVTRKKDLMDEDDLIEMELEDGIELAAGSEKIKGDRSQSWVKSSNRSENEDLHQGKQQEDASNGRTDLSNVEEGEVSALADGGQGYHSLISSDRKRKSPPLNGVEKKQRCDYSPGTAHHNQFDHAEDHSEVGRVVHTEMDHKRQVQENHV